MTPSCQPPVTILGLESSCDETAAAIVRFNGPANGEVLSDIVLSQIDEHIPYGGVVPEIAARAHIDAIEPVVQRALDQAQLSLKNIDAIAATVGPGLVGGLLVGAVVGKTLAKSVQKPFFAVNHLEGHALTTRLTQGLKDPHLLLLVSGGHTQMLLVHDVGHYERLGTTIDDAAGEAFDKTAKLLGLGYPGGPEVERRAAQGDSSTFTFPRPMKGRTELHFSFSGLKTAVRLAATQHQPVTPATINDICASFQLAVSDMLADRLSRGLDVLTERYPALKPSLVVSGGVAANGFLRVGLQKLCDQKGADLILPPLKWCTDNAVMIAWAAAENWHKGAQDGQAIAVRPRWPLDETAELVRGAGVKA